MAEKFWIFSDAFCFVGFLTQILYILTPIAFVIQLKNGVLHQERVSIFGLLSLYCNAVIYFLTSIYKTQSGKDIDPLDFCNMGAFYLGFIYLVVYIYFIHYKANKMKGIIFIIILIVGTLIVWLVIHFTIEKGNIWDEIFSWIGVVFNVTEYFPLGFSIIYLIKNKISEKYTLFGATFGFVNCTAWLSWAINACFVNHDNLYHSLVANSLGICLEIAQFTLFFLFRNKDNEDNSNIEDKTRNISDADMDIGNSKEENKDPEYMADYI
jgi:hypothetical protein